MSNGFADTAILMTRDGLGQGEAELRHLLVRNYLRTLLELGYRPKSILFYADGVKLAAQGSPCLDELAALAAAGVPLIVCRTCLDYLGLADRLAVGEIGNMMRIVEAQEAAQKVITA